MQNCPIGHVVITPAGQNDPAGQPVQFDAKNEPLRENVAVGHAVLLL
jgi:hypothetical protein